MQRFDYKALKSGFNKSAETYERHAKVASLIGLQLIDRLRTLNLNPERILDLGAGTGKLSRDLLKIYPKARIYCIDLSENRLRFAKGKRRWFKQQHYISADMHALPFAPESFDLVISNLAWHWSEHLNQAIYEAKRVLKINGKLIFSTWGPDTLRELRESFSAVSTEFHVNSFLDMHDLGDALLKAGLADPVMDSEHSIRYTGSVQELLRELHESGERNYRIMRRRGLTGKKVFKQMLEHYEQYRVEKQFPVTTEAVFGYAWRKAENSFSSSSPEEVAVPVGSIRRL